MQSLFSGIRSRSFRLIGHFQCAVFQFQRATLFDGSSSKILIRKCDKGKAWPNAVAVLLGWYQIDFRRFRKEFLQIGFFDILRQLTDVDRIRRCLLLLWNCNDEQNDQYLNNVYLITHLVSSWEFRSASSLERSVAAAVSVEEWLWQKHTRHELHCQRFVNVLSEHSQNPIHCRS